MLLETHTIARDVQPRKKFHTIGDTVKQLPRLRAVADLPQRKAKKPPNICRSVVGQVRLALRRENRLASTLGFLLGGFVPTATYTLSHFELPQQWWTDPRAYIVGGGLVYSAKKVLQWGTLAFGDRWLAMAFVVLTEGVMVASATHWLSLFALAILVGINGTATAVSLSKLDNRE